MLKNELIIDPLTKEEIDSWPKETLIKMEKPFVDKRGEIKPLVDKMMKSAVIIYSKSGSLRANHYHKTDWHYCYVIYGRIEYFHRPFGSKEQPEILLANKSEMIFTPPLVEHCMKFPIDTSFITLSRNPRHQEAYESDVVRVNMINVEGSISWSPEEDGK